MSEASPRVALVKGDGRYVNVTKALELIEGDIHLEGEKVDLRVTLASTDFVACDSVAARLMGFDIANIGYLCYCHQGGLGQGDISRIEVIGESIEACARTFKPHPSFQRQLNWHIPDVENYL